MIKNCLHYAVAAALAVASNIALAEIETEPNDLVSSTQRLVIGASGSIEVSGAIGVVTLTTPVTADVDFYSFHGKAGDVVTIDIDGGMKPTGSSVRSLDSVLVIYGPDLTVLRQVDDVSPATVDPGSNSRFDARLDNVSLPVSGVYTVGVASSGRIFLPGGDVTPFVARSTSNGSYTLIVSGVTPTMMQIGIDIRPGVKKIAKINPQSKRKLAVALLSSPDFDATKADHASITFGPTGTETTGRCGPHVKNARDDDDEDDDDDGAKHRKDVNRDGYPDLVCRFEIRAAGFDEGDTEGVVKGTINGMPFEGRGWLKVIPVKKRHDD